MSENGFVPELAELAGGLPTADALSGAASIPVDGGLYPELPQPLRSHAHYIKAALSTYDGGPAAQDVADAWAYILGALAAGETMRAERNDAIAALSRMCGDA